jgi:uncharacterized DUF497 family protein
VLRFEWNDAKNAENKRKHRVAFEEAETVFYDERGVLLEDDDEGGARDERFVLVGLSASLRVLVVCHTYRRREQVIRLISARRANRAERADYEARWRR